jgi:opacity protein-like surface antigen
MIKNHGSRTTTTIGLASLALVLLASATVANAQTREGRWEFSLGTMYQLTNSLDFDGGSTMNSDADFGFSMTTGYNPSDRVTLNFGLAWAGVGYDAKVKQDNGGTTSISGTYDTWAISANALFNLTEGKPLVPYIGAGIGWTWVDSNVPSGLPSTGCWWDPWYGYICYTTYPTHSTDVFSYQALAGIRYEFNSRSFMRFGYTSQWLSLSNAKTTPRYDVINLEFGWMF